MARDRIGQERRDTLPWVIGAVVLIAVLFPGEPRRPDSFLLVTIAGAIAWVIGRCRLDKVLEEDEVEPPDLS